MKDPLKYKRVEELRKEILLACGVDPGDRFDDSDRGIRKANLLLVVAELQPEHQHWDFAEMKITNLYELLAEWTGEKHDPNSGRDWTMNKDLLKAIHRELIQRDKWESQ